MEDNNNDEQFLCKVLMARKDATSTFNVERGGGPTGLSESCDHENKRRSQRKTVDMEVGSSRPTPDCEMFANVAVGKQLFKDATPRPQLARHRQDCPVVPGAFRVFPSDHVRADDSDSHSWGDYSSSFEEAAEESDIDDPPLPAFIVSEDEDYPTTSLAEENQESQNLPPCPPPPLVESKAFHEETLVQRIKNSPFFAGVGLVALVGVVIVLAVAVAGFLQGEDEQNAPSFLQTIKNEGALGCANFRRISPFEMALCHAIEAAIFGIVIHSENLLPSTDGNFNRFAAVLKRDVDVGSKSVGHSMEREIYQKTPKKSPYAFTVPYLFDGMQIAGEANYVACVENNWDHLGDCSGINICCIESSFFVYDQIAQWLPERRITKVQNVSDSLASFANGTCNVFPVWALHRSYTDVLSAFAKDMDEFAISSKYFSKEPSALISRPDEPEFANFVNSVLQALIVAEAHNITQATADAFPDSQFFGKEYKDMYRNAIRANGNFGELYDKFQAETVPRSFVNRVYTKDEMDTGLLYARPFGDLSNPREDEDPLGGTLRSVLAQKRLRCGVRMRPGFVTMGDSNQDYHGMEVDLCRAVAAGLFTTIHVNEYIEFVEFRDAHHGLQLLASGEVDLCAGIPYTLPNYAKGFSFSQPYFYGYSAEEDNFALATRQDDTDWAGIVAWMVDALIYAEENSLGREDAFFMPEVSLFGSELTWLFRSAVAEVGNYQDLYSTHLEALYPRATYSRNNLNINSLGAQHYPVPGFF